jgi:HlyD family secretion protein
MATHAAMIPDDLGASFDAVADPRRDIRAGAIVSVLFFVLFLGWAAFARLDAAAYARGVLEVSGERQAVQHRDGGVVGAIYVSEGQFVKEGQLLIELSAPEVRAQERALQSQMIDLLAQQARLEAEQLDLPALRRPEEFSALGDVDRHAAEAALARQTAELRVRRAVLSAQKGAFSERASQSGALGRGYDEQQRSTAEQIRLIDEQIDALGPLEAEGFVSKTRVRELQRARAELAGRRGQYAANVVQTKGAANENKLQELEADRSFHERAASDMRDVYTRLGDVLPRLRAAREQLALTQIRAPATGSVVSLAVFTRGGVIMAGQKLMDIVPASQPLRIEARFAPDDADDLEPGARTLVRFPGLHERRLPDLEGKLTRLSADKLSDERTGMDYFTGEVTVPVTQLDLIKQVRGRGFALRPGMPVEILIPLRKRSALDYALEPLVGSFWSSFHEH